MRGTSLAIPGILSSSRLRSASDSDTVQFLIAVLFTTLPLAHHQVPRLTPLGMCTVLQTLFQGRPRNPISVSLLGAAEQCALPPPNPCRIESASPPRTAHCTLYLTAQAQAQAIAIARLGTQPKSPPPKLSLAREHRTAPQSNPPAHPTLLPPPPFLLFPFSNSTLPKSSFSIHSFSLALLRHSRLPPSATTFRTCALHSCALQFAHPYRARRQSCFVRKASDAFAFRVSDGVQYLPATVATSKKGIGSFSIQPSPCPASASFDNINPSTIANP